MNNVKQNMIKLLAEVGINDFVSIPLQNSDGFILYSKETLEDCDIKLKTLYEACYEQGKLPKEKNVYRYGYYKRCNSSPLHATIVMMNPAFADSQNSDDTIKNIEDYLCGAYKNFGSYEIINLYPIRMPKSAQLDKFLAQTKSETKKYQEFVKKYLEDHCKDSIIIAAWGANKNNNIVANELFQNSNIKLYCYGLTKDKFPKHFARQSYYQFTNSRYPLPYIQINYWLKNKEILTEYDKFSLLEAKRIKEWVLKNVSGPCSHLANRMLLIYEDLFDNV